MNALLPLTGSVKKIYTREDYFGEDFMLLMIKQRRNGTTLLELMIVLTVIGIIAVVAYPSYKETIHKGRRADAITSLLKLQMDQEKWRASHIKYAGVLDGDHCGTVNATGLCWGDSEITRGFYHMAITESSDDGTGFVATATPRKGTDQEHDVCQLIVINQDGPDPEASSDPACWNR